MNEDFLNSASSTPSSTVALSMSEAVPKADERQIIVESTADSSESSCTEEKPSPARFENTLNLITFQTSPYNWVAWAILIFLNNNTVRVYIYIYIYIFMLALEILCSVV